MAPIDTVLQKEHSSYQKYHLAKIAPNVNGISQNWYLTTTLLAFWSTTNTLLIKPTAAIRHRRVIGISLWSGKNLNLKSHNHESESYNKFKNFLLEIIQLSPWHFFASCAILLRYHFCGCHVFLFQVEYLSCAIFVRCQDFQMVLKGAIIVGCIWGLSNCNYFLFYQ